MALEKPNNTYWKIVEVHIQPVDRYAEVIMACWETKANMDAGEKETAISNLIFRDSDFDFEWNQNIMSQLYVKIKNHPEWIQAQDV